jgi:5'-nucleotidase
MSRTLTVIHTNDFHNHLTPAQAAMIAKLHAEAGPDSLLLDAGDAILAGNVGVRLAGEPVLRLMSEADYDAMTMGNREFHVADTVLRHKIGDAKFPVLSANMRYKEDRGERLPVVPSITKTTAGGIRVGVFGLTVPMVTERMAARHLSAYLFDDPLKTARREIDALRPNVDVLILLSHVGYKLDLKIAAEFPELDLVVGGHSHVVLDEADRSGGVPVVQTGSFGRYVGVVVLGEGTGARWSVTSSRIVPLAPGAEVGE